MLKWYEKKRAGDVTKGTPVTGGDVRLNDRATRSTARFGHT
ncbi:MAG: hypothetical protein H6Q67_551 [Firmicutes bacterium]|nr:hypothetical protein [Bacillota bacterium]